MRCVLVVAAPMRVGLNHATDAELFYGYETNDATYPGHQDSN